LAILGQKRIMKSNFYDRFVELKRYTDRVGSIYGTEDFSVYLYSIIKMMKPETVVELGTGLGSAMLWSGLALEENEFGTIHTIDDGSEWYRLKTAKNAMGDHYHDDYNDFITGLVQKYEVQDQVNFLNQRIDVLDLKNIDILFSDFAHGVFDVTKLLVDYIPKMNDHSKIYIDSASTHYSSYMAINRIVDILNSGRIPRTFYEVFESKNNLQKEYNIENLKQKVENTTFSVEHMVENKDRDQNSTCCITLTPIDIFPYPRKNIRSL
jgi:predicted O-methyltransferase YrrM